MADGSQHLGQIMETQTRFDLTTAIENWRQELAAQPDLTPDVRWELETHLRDTVAGFQRRGLNGEESFWLARRRVGQPKQLGEEFTKADPAKVWRERLFWIAGALFVMELWGAVVSGFWYEYYGAYKVQYQTDRLYDTLPSWISFYLPQWLTEIRTYAFGQIILVLMRYLPILFFAIFLLKGRLDRVSWGAKFLIESRMRFVVWTFALLMTVEFFRAFMMAGSFGLTNVLTMQLSSAIWPLSLLTFMAWLMPIKKSTALKRA
jgi:hypothetical protein